MKFEIVKGREYVATFVIKRNGSTTPIELDDVDTGTFTISKNGVNPQIVLENIPMTISNASGGEFTLTLDADDTDLLFGEVGLREDGYVSYATYKGVAEFNTVEQGKMIAVVERIYCVDMG